MGGIYVLIILSLVLWGLADLACYVVPYCT